MALEFLWKGVVDFGEPGVFVTFEEMPQDITRNVKSLGWDLAELLKQNTLRCVYRRGV
jgi:circadian clock protein KaiC